jgi:hypothetical protein
MTLAALCVLLLSAAPSAGAQAPSGRVSGSVEDVSGAPVGGVELRLVSGATGAARVTDSSPNGEFSLEALLPGAYVLTADRQGFKRVQLDVQVDAGSRTVADIVLAPGDVSETLAVEGATPLMRPNDHYVGGVVTRAQIDALPLNGRNFLDLAKLEPAVSNPVRAAFGRTFIAVLGSGLQTIPRVGYTRVTIDGGSINGFGFPGTVMQVSQEAVQEFQLSSASFDPSTGLTSSGAVTVATRSAGRQLHADAFGFFRDHHMSAYPALKRSAVNPDPFFQRAQYGGTGGGALWRGHAFLFATAERNDERGVVTIQAIAPEFAALGGIFPSPSSTTLATIRVDAPLNRRNTAFLRYSLDRGSAFTGTTLPSAWDQLDNRAGQAVASLTTTLTSSLVNALRVSRIRVESTDVAADERNCPKCFGVGATRTAIAEAGITFGRTRGGDLDGTRYEIGDDLAWQHGSHRLRFGADWEHDSVLMASGLPWTEMTVWSPARVQSAVPGVELPAPFVAPDDVWQLSLQQFDTTVGPRTTPWRNFSADRTFDVFRMYGSDNWHVADRLTVDAGLGWSLEPNALNTDLAKPALLVPLLGENGVHGPRSSYTEFSPSAGAVWSITHDHRTLARVGIGRYVDPASSTNSTNLMNERIELLPLGRGQLTQTGDAIPFGSGTLSFTRAPTAYTAVQLLGILPGIQQGLLSLIDSSNRDFSIRNIDRLKQGTNLYDPSYRAPSSLHVTLGVQRELPAKIVVTADAVWKRYSHTFINGIDYNHFRRAAALGGPVIRPCVGDEGNDPTVVCSTGPFFFDTTLGRAQYKGLLVRVERRFDGHFQLLGSYALGSYTGTNGTGLATSEATGGRVFGFNNDNWYENVGPLPTDLRHMFAASGILRLPREWQVATSLTAYSRPPFSAWVANVDFNGDGTTNDLLPGTTINAFNRSLNRSDLVRLVTEYNVTYAGNATLGGSKAPAITLPTSFALDDRFFAEDIRLSKTFGFGSPRVGMTVLVDVFNVFNVANLVQFSGNLAAPSTFGQPGARFTQLFGSGGPRAIQIGTRIVF